MRRIARRSAFAATLCAGVAMVGASVHGMLGVDAELKRSAAAAAERERPALVAHQWDCPGADEQRV
jgi:hypothetical protein